MIDPDNFVNGYFFYMASENVSFLAIFSEYNLIKEKYLSCLTNVKRLHIINLRYVIYYISHIKKLNNKGDKNEG